LIASAHSKGLKGDQNPKLNSSFLKMKGDKNEGCVKSGESFGGVPYQAERSAG